MSRIIKIVKVTEDTCVAFANFEGVGVASMILDTTGMGKHRIETDFLARFNTQLVKKRKGVRTRKRIARNKYYFEWYNLSEIEKGNPVLLNPVEQKKEDLYVVDVDVNGKPTCRKADHLFTEEEVKIELMRLALGGK